MAFNLCVPEFNSADIVTYFQKELLKKKEAKLHEKKNDYRKESSRKLGKKEKVSFQNNDNISEDSSSNDESNIQEPYCQVKKHRSCTTKKKRKLSDQEGVDMPVKNTRETKLFRHL